MDRVPQAALLGLLLLLTLGGCTPAFDAPVVIDTFSGASEVLPSGSGSISVQGVATNRSDAPVANLSVQVTFLAAEQQVAATKTVPLSDAPLAPGESTAFRVLADWQPEIVAYTVALLDGDGRQLTVTPWKGLH